MRAVIIDYGVGNLFSIYSGLRRVGFEVEISKEPKGSEDLIVFPGVGSFSAVSKYLVARKEKFEVLRSNGTGFLGICLGMQIMFEEGTEGGLNKGLGWLKGRVDKINHPRVKIPHIGWDKVNVIKYNELSEGIDDQYVYYAHSYVAYPTDKSVILSTTSYGIDYPAVVNIGNIVGTQFHPEKSSLVGRKFLTNVYRWLRK
ncbi:imidazole glycerol phosphate synthase subunit HisH [Sulfolobus acidocaldarius]|uniref:Imidazole glycerol phosphate synthase subunit HisH n=4 Tax=Sulfolobus acidocaldarius TaxID=2285 RepID=HIS5_SULAC|nr:imidazole glycerol phosphate synthase subunit HisH [Sulfolobus acidocaldarius]Q4J8I5.1 RecName: Full=Imidazole glycerol phosphate synthase subunit HisH; AltName: Full=IGP synthase glutaminase subunit; AltName: Full=IGP synthase subunit HisH; AltName: Full=ImGP synthase subunit HisH; Short=IGPS subunit HisH [Sulfolobus acidocaldarius DSM 639]AAY80894.1 imidazole glycerol phosphate synthase subunit hisH [Sulfolobus acidocaldarius DSM 639]AGE71494.1 imidazole glycerol phosphate synthase subunit 